MALEPVHVYSKDRATNRATLTHINPTRVFCVGQRNEGLTEHGNRVPPGLGWYTWQNGSWYGIGGGLIEEKDVPAELKENIHKVPLTDNELAGPSVTKVCKFCDEKMNASVYDTHVEEHVAELLRGAAAKAVETKSKAPQA